MSDPIEEDPLALEQQVCFALSVAARGVVAVYRPLLEPMGLTHPQYLVMLALWQHAPLSVRDLSRLLQLDPGTLSPLLKRLEAAGYVRRERDAADERSLAVTLTAAGQALRAQAERIPPAIVQRLGLPLADLRHLHTALTEVIAAANRAAAVGAAPDQASGPGQASASGQASA
ncbi:MarR family winged helix-turn-helix transcriptional regulator [Micromonospora chalcea]|uniref:MarR family winged helix-turn-helix transcriptional regulator n=1 Tax=Micromonospora sp. B006 TaxID=2201999 RepID=UPI000E308DE8|nr:MarR family transcriptional regulator [Micromonospora sp. B006]AXO32325.1 organic hydroperoxide resistance transcriptional regulator [Micromonospora sp. B006]